MSDATEENGLGQGVDPESKDETSSPATSNEPSSKAAAESGEETAGQDAPAILSRDAFLDVEDIVTKVVEVPEWGGAVRIKSLSLGERTDIRERSMVDGEIDDQKFDIYTFLSAVVEPKLSQDDYEAVRSRNAVAFGRVMRAILMLAGWGDTASTEAEATFPD